MLMRFLDSKKTTLLLAVTAILLATALYSVYLSQQNAQASVTSNVMYFVPDSSQQIEKNLSPEEFAKIPEVKVGYTSDWKVISNLVQEGKLDALIIHEAAKDRVNLAQLREWFSHRGLVVGGVGIPVNELAEMVNIASLKNWGGGHPTKPHRTFTFFLSEQVVR